MLQSEGLCLNQVGGAKHGGRQEQVKLAEREDVVWQAGEGLRWKKKCGDIAYLTPQALEKTFRR